MNITINEAPAAVPDPAIPQRLDQLEAFCQNVGAVITTLAARLEAAEQNLTALNTPASPPPDPTPDPETKPVKP
jgi:hypothetical protein